MNLIIPAAGSSSRFPGMRPKWMLVHPNGNLMLIEAIRGLALEKIDHIHIGLLEEHTKQYDCMEGLEKQLESLGVWHKTVITIIEKPTRHQPETVAVILRRQGISGAIFIKDVDNYFAFEPKPVNAVAVYDLSKMATVNAANKSYVITDDHGLISNIVEKKVISSLFCCGGYSFAAAEEYLKYYDPLASKSNLYLSHVIYSMLLDNMSFVSEESRDYCDWGTLSDWNSFRETFSSVFIDLDGTLVKNSAQHFKPYWGSTEGILENIQIINKLYDSGRAQIIITTSRKSEYRDVTLAQLKREGIKYHQIHFDMLHAKRIIVNDYSGSNPYKCCDAINVRRDSTDLVEMIKESLRI